MDIKNIILETLINEVTPAIGCTEPVAVSLACAKARELADTTDIIGINVLVSPNIYKNGLGVGIPNTKEVGLNIAAGLGIVGGDSNKGLKVLEDINNSKVLEAKRLVDDNIINLGIKNTSKKVYIEVILISKYNYSKVIIEDKHNNFTHLEKDGKILYSQNIKDNRLNPDKNPLHSLKIREIISEIENMDSSKMEFLLEGIEMNENIAHMGLENKLGIGVGHGFYKNIISGLMSDDLINNAMMLTASGADARMSGINMPVMSSNGSGNNGLTAILPIVAYIRKFPISKDKLIKALAISHLINCYIKYYIGRLSALCGCGVAAATGSSAAITWIMDGDYDQIDGAIKNMIANLSGMICDGAKASCALKLSTSASVCIQSALLAINDNVAFSKNGIIGDTAEETIINLGKLSNNGMSSTDKVILDIMKNMA